MDMDDFLRRKYNLSIPIENEELFDKLLLEFSQTDKGYELIRN